MSRVIISAEPGCTHGGSLDMMRELIRVAAECGADAFKSQWVSSPERLCERRRAPEYLEAYRLIAFPAEWHGALRKACDEAGLLYGCTCYLLEDVPVVAPVVAFHKIASFEAGDRRFLEAHIPSQKLLWISTGMMQAEEVEELDFHLWAYDLVPWPAGRQSTLLHCVSAYPCPIEQANLGAIRWMKEGSEPRILSKIGFSDHTGSLVTGALAVAAGAQALEVHARLDDADPANPDYPHALPPRMFQQYIDNVRIAETAMGDGCKRIMPAEEKMLRYRRTSHVI